MTLTPKKLESKKILAVSVPVPLRQTFDFLAPNDGLDTQAMMRVRVPFGQRKLVGVILEVKQTSDYPIEKLKSVIEVLDDQPVFDKLVQQTLRWMSRYYLAPIGEVFDLAMPTLLRKGESVIPRAERVWQLSDHGRAASLDELNRAPLQLAIIKRFMQQSTLSSNDFRHESGSWRASVKALVEKNWLSETTQLPQLENAPQGEQTSSDVGFTLTAQQQAAAEHLSAAVNDQSFACTLLQGVTGSGKTEVYFAAMQVALDMGKSILMVVPEIGLTPQLVQRIEHRFEMPVTTIHSGLNDTERHLAWWFARQGQARIVLGTRSAIFTPVPALGLIIVDEEHDASLKQQDGVRYQARDVAVYRAKLHDVPIVLGSATPSLETYLNACEGRYQHLHLRERATDVAMPNIELLDLNVQAVSEGLCPAMAEAIQRTLSQNKQIILFLNRRGYAPVHYCVECKAAAKCHRCDSNLTVHQRANKLRCHHCGYEGRLDYDCKQCKTEKSMREVGDGTQRVETALATRFAQARVLRIDRDNSQRKGALENALARVREGEVDIVLGTQLISKGHDFPNVGMVGILEADQGLYSTDYRASEMLFQQILQVAGRAGRRDDIGRVFIQTRFPEHPFFGYVQNHDFDGFAKQLLAEREQAGYPPHRHSALLRAESTHQAKALQFLRRAKQDCNLAQDFNEVNVMDAVPAPMERRQGRYRAQLLFTATQRSSLNSVLRSWLHKIATDPEAKKRAASVRWSLDIDPHDHF